MKNLLLTGFVLAAFASALAQADYPEKTIQIIVPNGAGGSTDLTTRLIVSSLAANLNQGIAVINVPGAGTSIGAQRAARSKPDGYTLLSTHEALLTSSALNLNRMGPETLRPIAQLAREALVIAVPPDSPLQDLDDYFAAVKRGRTERPLKLGVNPGAVSHFALMRTLAGVNFDVVFVPTGGGAKTLKSLMGGHIDIGSFTISEFYQTAEAGDLRALAVLDSTRHPRLPDTPTSVEQGHDIRFGVHYVWYAPIDTPDSVIEILASAMQETLYTGSLQQEMLHRSLTPDFVRGPDLDMLLDSRYREIQAIAEDVRDAAR